MNKIFEFISLQFFIFIFTSCTLNNQDLTTENHTEVSEDINCYDTNCFINNLVLQGNFTLEYLNYFFSNVTIQDNIIDIMNRPTTSMPWYKFLQNNINDKKVLQGVKFYIDNQEVLNQVYEKYKVSPEIIVATLGVETNYGKYQGNFNVADSLYTLAFHYPRRYKYFQEELKEYLFMVKNNNFNPFELKGSYAGAMGYPQFMPSSFNKYAKSYNNQTFPDIWNNVADAIVSIANYYHYQGWIDKDLVMIEVKLTPNDVLESIMNEKTNLKYSVKELKQLGIIPLQDINDDQLVILFKLEVAPNSYKYYIGLNNFYVIWKYNNSRNYVSLVYTLAKQIESKLF